MGSVPDGVAPECYYKCSEELVSGRHQAFYWEKAFQLAGLSVLKSDCSFAIDTLINSFETKILNDSGSSKFPYVTSHFKVVSSLSHGNCPPENRFSISRYIIQTHGTSVDLDTIEALRFVKDGLLSYGCILDIPITKSFLPFVKLAYSCYKADLEAKHKMKEEEETAKKQENLKLEKKNFCKTLTSYSCIHSTSN